MSKQRVKNFIPNARVPATVQLKKLHAMYEHLQRTYEKQRRLMWSAIHACGGRIEINAAVFAQTMQAPPADVLTKVENYTNPVSKEEMVVLVFCDEDGKRAPESDPKLVLATDS